MQKSRVNSKDPSQIFEIGALKQWPRGVKEIKTQIQDIKQGSVKMPKKPFGIKEDSKGNIPNRKIITPQIFSMYIKSFQRPKESWGKLYDEWYTYWQEGGSCFADIYTLLDWLNDDGFSINKIEVIDSEEINMDLPSHTWMKFNGKYYDLSTPNGVDNFQDLSFYKKKIPKKLKEDSGFMFPAHDLGSTAFMTSQHPEQERRKRKGKKPKNPEKIESVEKEAKTFNKELIGQPWKSKLKESLDKDEWKKPGESNHPARTFYYQGTPDFQEILKWDANDWKIAQDKIMAGDPTGEWTARAGREWEHFDFRKGWEHLKKVSNIDQWLGAAMRWWPRGTEETRTASEEMKASSKKMPKKPFKLKENLNTDASQNGLFVDAEMNRDLEKGTKASMKRYQKRTKGALKSKKRSMVIPPSDAHTIDITHQKMESVIELNNRVREICEFYDKGEKSVPKKKVSFNFPPNKTKLNEALQMIRFHYTNYKHEPPIKNVKILDVEYPGQVGQKTYGRRRDLLGWDINEYANKEEAVRSIDEIDSFARLLTADNLEKYRRIKVLFPEQAKLIRRYILEYCKGLRVKKEDGLWYKTSIDEIKQRDSESF